METAKLQESCVHHWVIETPQGPTSQGVCKKCGLVREFCNVWTDSFNEHQMLSANQNEEKAAVGSHA